jgi:hypothetical protein
MGILLTRWSTILYGGRNQPYSCSVMILDRGTGSRQPSALQEDCPIGMFRGRNQPYGCSVMILDRGTGSRQPSALQEDCPIGMVTIYFCIPGSNIGRMGILLTRWSTILYRGRNQPYGCSVMILDRGTGSRQPSAFQEDCPIGMFRGRNQPYGCSVMILDRGIGRMTKIKNSKTFLSCPRS